MDRDRPVFSLVELIVVIAVMGIFTAIALPHDVHLRDGASLVENRHNAQNIVTTSPAGSAAEVLWRAGDVATKATPLTTGYQPLAGAFSAAKFQSTVTAGLAVTPYLSTSVPMNRDP